MIVFIPGIFPASHIVDNYGLGLGFKIGAVMNVVGALLRVLPWPIYNISDIAPYSFIPVFIGQTICAAAQTFIIAMPPYLAQNWFGESERVTATAIGALANQLGIAVGFFLCPLIVPEDSDDFAITKLLLLLSLFCISSLILILIFFQSKPASPPSRSAQVQESESVEKLDHSLKSILPLLFKDINYINLCICFGMVIGCFYAVSTLLNQMLYDLNYGDSTTVLVGTLMVIVGIFGAFIFGILGDKLKKYKLLLVICVVGTFISMILWTFTFKEDNTVIICIGSSLLGFFMTALLPISMDIAVEITFPLPEAIVSNVLMASAQVFGIILIAICTPLLQYVSIVSVNFTILLASAISSCLILFFHTKSKRGLVESTMPSDSVSNDTSSN